MNPPDTPQAAPASTPSAYAANRQAASTAAPGSSVAPAPGAGPLGGTLWDSGSHGLTGEPGIDRMIRLERALKQYAPLF